MNIEWNVWKGYILTTLIVIMFISISTNVHAIGINYSTNSRYLVDQNGGPWPILGRTAWNILSQNVSDYQLFINDTVSKGYNSIEVWIIGHDARGYNVPFAGNGASPFVKQLNGSNWNGDLTYSNINTQAPDFTTPNEAYWSYVDTFLSYCNSKDIVVFMFPAYVGYDGNGQGWFQEMLANGPTKMQQYGQWIATRYQNYSNIIWMMGGDMGSFNAAETNAEGGLYTGLKNASNQQSTQFSAEWDNGMIGTDQSTFGPNMTLNSIYSWANLNDVALRAYPYTPVRPAFLLEEPYDEEGPDGNNVDSFATQPVRRFQWWVFLDSIGGYISGNGYIWPFNTGVWKDHLDTQGTRDMAKLNAFIKSIEWWNLVPSGLDGTPTLITAGQSTVYDDDYVTSAVTPNGTLLVAYIPPNHTGSITVNMTVMQPNIYARWFDPVNGTYTVVAGSPFNNNGTRSFTPTGTNAAGENDWVLVLENATDTTPPIISSVNATVITNVSAIIIWNTDESSNSSVEYGTSLSLGSLSYDVTTSTSHSVTLNGLTNETLYYFNVTSCDATGNCNTSGAYNFTTTNNTDMVYPVVRLISPSNNTEDWITNQTFQCNISDNLEAGNLTLYIWNSTGNNILLNTTVVGGAYNSSSWSYIFSYNDTFKWTCQGADAANNAVYASEGNYTLTIIPTPALVYPSLTFTSPTPADGLSTKTRNQTFNVSISNSSGMTKFIFDWNGTNYSYYDSNLILLANLNNLTAIGEGTVNKTKVADVSIKGYNGTCVGMGTSCKWIANGKHDGAISTVTNGYVDFGDINETDNTNQLTISAWIKRGAIGHPVLVGKESGSFDEISIQLWTDGNLIFGIGNAPTAPLGQVASNDANWHHVVMVYNGSATGNSNRLKGYLDGVLQTLDYQSTTIPAVTPSLSTSFELGFPFEANNDGSYDEVYIWNRTLSDAEVQSLYRSSLSKFASDNWSYIINQLNLSDGQYTYFATASNSLAVNRSGNMTLTIDNAVPSISSINASYITNQSVEISWNASEASNSTVKYGNTLSLTSTVYDTALYINHSLAVSDLINNTLYYYNVTSCDAAGNCNTSGPRNFTTLQNNDTTPPATVTNLANISATNASIFWNWTNPTDSDFNYTKIFIDGANVINLSSSISSYNATGFSPNTSHIIEVWTVDNSSNINNTNVSNIAMTSANPDIIPPIISNISSSSITNQSATISWSTDEPSNATLSYGTTLALVLSSKDFTLSTSHAFGLSNLTNNTLYYYNVTSCDAAHNCNTSGVFNFTTLQNNDTIPPSILFQGQTDANNSYVNRNWSFVNVSQNDLNNGSYFIDWNRSLVGWWRFNNEAGENSTFFKDWSTYGNNATCSGIKCPTPDQSGEFGGTLIFNGTQSVITQNQTMTMLNQFTLSAWVKASVSGLILRRQTLNTTLSFGLDSDDDMAWCASSNASISNVVRGISHLNDDSWHFVACTFNGTNAVIYVDGVIEGSSSTFKVVNFNDVAPIYIGDGEIAHPSITGSIDDIKIFNRALMWQEINASYDAARPLYNNFTDLTQATYTYTAYSQDLAGNVNYTEQRFLTVDTTSPASISGLLNASSTNTSIYWMWTNPVETDFNGTMVFVDGSNIANLSSTANFYNASGYSPDTSHIINVWTFDKAGNVNDTNVTNITSTLANPETVPPSIIVSYSPSNPNSTQNITFTANASDSSGISNITLYVNGSLVKLCFVADCSYISGYFVNGTNVTYYANATDNSSNHNVNMSIVLSFIVLDPLDNVSPAISGINVTNITNQSAIIHWLTDENANSSLDYGVSTSLGIISFNASLSTSRNIPISGLLNNTLYYFNVSSCDSSGNCNISGIYNFTTLQNNDTSPPSTISSLTNASATNVSIYWVWNNPADADFNYTIIFIDGINLINLSSSINFYNATGFSPNTSHIIDIWTVDTSGNINDTNVTNITSTLANPETVAPSIIVGYSPSSPNSTQNVTYFANATDSSGIYNISLYVNNTLIKTCASSSCNYTSGFYANGTNITYYANATDNSSNHNVNMSIVLSFIVLDPLDNVSPVISGINAINITNQSAIIHWSTDENSNSTISYGVTLALSSKSANSTLSTNHSFTLLGLTNNTLYYYNVTSCDAAHNCNTSGVFNFTTLQNNDTTSPGSISNLMNVSATNVSILWNWTNPSDVDFNGTLIFIDGTNIINLSSSIDSYNATGFITNSSHTIKVWTMDTSGNINNTNVTNISKTLENPRTVPPAISNISIVSITNESSVITWSTDEAANSSVEYGTNISLGSSTYDEALLMNHSIALIGLINNTLYYFNVSSCDSNMNCNTSNILNFTTLQTNDTIPPIMTNLSPSGALSSTTSVLLSLYTNENAICRYNLTDAGFNNMTGNFTNNITYHYTTYAVASGNSYRIYIRCMDISGNVDNSSAVINFSISSSTGNSGGNNGGGGGGGGGGGPSQTPVINPNTTSTPNTTGHIGYYWYNVSAGTHLERNITITNVGISKIMFALKDFKNDILLSITEAADAPALPQDYSLYQYTQFNSENFSTSDIQFLNITFSVKRSWLDANNIDHDNIRMLRYNTTWSALATYALYNDTDNFYYIAESPGMSYFAIAALQETVSTEPESTTIHVVNSPKDINRSAKIKMPGAEIFEYIVAGILVACLGYALVVLGKKQKEKHDEAKPSLENSAAEYVEKKKMLQEWIEDARAKRYSDENIRNILLQHKCDEKLVDEILAERKMN